MNIEESNFDKLQQLHTETIQKYIERQQTKSFNSG